MLDNLHNYINIITAVVALASAVAAITPTPMDNSIVGKVYKIVDFLALNVFKAKQKG